MFVVHFQYEEYRKITMIKNVILTILISNAKSMSKCQFNDFNQLSICQILKQFVNIQFPIVDMEYMTFLKKFFHN